MYTSNSEKISVLFSKLRDINFSFFRVYLTALTLNLRIASLFLKIVSNLQFFLTQSHNDLFLNAVMETGFHS